MTTTPPRDEIENELLRAEKSLHAAQLLLKEQLLEDCLSRTYYAIVHAARAALLAHGVSVASHRAVRRLFGQHLIKSGKLAAHLSQILAEEQDDRLLADYDVLFDPELDRAQQRVADAETFLTAINVFLNSQGQAPREA